VYNQLCHSKTLTSYVVLLSQEQGGHVTVLFTLTLFGLLEKLLQSNSRVGSTITSDEVIMCNQSTLVSACVTILSTVTHYLQRHLKSS